MTFRRSLLFVLTVVPCFGALSFGQESRFKVLAFYSRNAEPDHVRFAQDAIKFLNERAASEHFTFDVTTRWEDLNDERLKTYQLVIWLNESPRGGDQRHAFERYIERGGAWLGFHAAGYNDKDTNWPWFVDFLGGAVFYTNSWPPLPAKLVIDDRFHPVTVGLAGDFESPSNEWYVWKPSPRLNKDVRVLATFDPSNYPIGFKDVLTSGDLPVVWTNTKYKMLYMNMGHGDKIFTSPRQNQLIDEAVNWLGMGATQPAAPEPKGIRINPRGIALNPRTGKFYAVNTPQDAVTVLDGDGQILDRIQVGREPASIAINPEANRVYVANSGSGTVSVIDGASDKVIATVTVGDLPYAIAFNPVTQKIYVSRTFSNLMTVVDGKTNRASTIDPGVQADAIAVDSVANKIYLVSYEDREVTVIDGANDQFSKIEAVDHLWAIAANPAVNRIYAVNAGIAKLEVIHGTSKSTRLLDTGEIPCAVAVDSSSGRVFVANYGSGSVTVIDGISDAVVASVNVNPNPQALAIDSANHKVYVASLRTGTITVLNGTNNSVQATVKIGKAPFAIAVNDKTHKAVVVGLDGDLTVVDGTSLGTSSPSVQH
jgi:uncharacterized protein